MKAKLSLEKYLDRYLKIRPRSQFEVEQKLAQKGYPPRKIKGALEKLKKDNLINDHQFAELWVHHREILNPRGKRLLAFELRKKGISQEIIDEVLSFDEEYEFSLAQKALEDKKRAVQNLDNFSQRQKLLAFLSRRGFSYGVAKNAVENFLKS